MNQINLGIKMLLKDWKSNLYYLLTIAIVSMTSFIFGNMNRNPNLKVEMEINQFGNYIPRYSGFITMIVIGFSLFLTIYAYSYLLIKKSKELKIIKVSGGSLKKMGVFLITQNTILIIIGSTFGTILGIIVNPLINYIILHFLHINESYFHFYMSSALDAFKVNIFTLFITSILGFGYIYRNEIKNMDEERTNWAKDNRMIKFPTAIHLFLYFMGVFMFLTSDDGTKGAVAYSLIGCCGAAGLIRITLCDILKKKLENSEREDKINKISLHGLIYTLKRNFLLVLGLLFSSTVMLSWTIGTIRSPKEYIVAFIAYITSLILLFNSTFFMYLADMKRRNKDYFFLFKCGYILKDLKRIIKKEIEGFYMIILLFSIIYILLIFMHPVATGGLEITHAIYIMLFYLIILFGMMIITTIVSTKIITIEIERSVKIK